MPPSSRRAFFLPCSSHAARRDIAPRFCLSYAYVIAAGRASPRRLPAAVPVISTGPSIASAAAETASVPSMAQSPKLRLRDQQPKRINQALTLRFRDQSGGATSAIAASRPYAIQVRSPPWHFAQDGIR
jgi:hypothetical protein